MAYVVFLYYYHVYINLIFSFFNGMKICCPVHFIAQCQLSGYAVTKTSDDFQPMKARILLILIRIKEPDGSRVFLDPKVTYRVFFELVQKGTILKFIQTFENCLDSSNPTRNFSNTTKLVLITLEKMSRIRFSQVFCRESLTIFKDIYNNKSVGFFQKVIGDHKKTQVSGFPGNVVWKMCDERLNQ